LTPLGPAHPPTSTPLTVQLGRDGRRSQLPMLRRLIPLSIATTITYYVFAVWYRGPDTSPARHPVPVAIAKPLAAAILLAPALTAFAIARRRGHTWKAAVALTGAEVVLAAAFALVLLILLPFAVLLMGGDHS
jgi:hypothetical protein